MEKICESNLDFQIFLTRNLYIQKRKSGVSNALTDEINIARVKKSLVNSRCFWKLSQLFSFLKYSICKFRSVSIPNLQKCMVLVGVTETEPNYYSHSIFSRRVLVSGKKPAYYSGKFFFFGR